MPRLKDRNKQTEVVEVPMPKKRGRCFFCHKVLFKGKEWSGFQVCTSAGIVVLTCDNHAEDGDKLIFTLNSWVGGLQVPK